jgi:formylglycine-generating enzyme required for sulfatase activity
VKGGRSQRDLAGRKGVRYLALAQDRGDVPAAQRGGVGVRSTGGTTTRYAFGDTISKSQAQFDTDKTAEVGSFPANKFGLHDMHGNVLERVEDAWHPHYQGAPDDGSVWSGGDTSLRVLRGGSFVSRAANLHPAIRGRSPPGSTNGAIGLRVARAL